MTIRTVAKNLPTPRLQLRWEPCQLRDYNWQCHYELVIELKETDIRREIYKNGRQLKKKLPRQFAIKMKEPQLRESTAIPCSFNDGRFADTPFRDGAHAKCDAEQLKLPVYVIAPDGMTFLVEDKPCSKQ